MYAQGWSPGLRQGDILAEVFFPQVTNQVTVITNTPSLTRPVAERPITSVILQGEHRFAVVVSHDCEFNEQKRNRLLVARVQSVPGNLTPEQRNELRASNDVESLLALNPDAHVAGVDSFLLDPLHGLFADEQVIVFTTITPFPMKMKNELLNSKRAELRHEDRVRLRQKLAWFFGRGGEDLPDDQKTPAPNLDEGASGAS